MAALKNPDSRALLLHDDQGLRFLEGDSCLEQQAQPEHPAH